MGALIKKELRSYYLSVAGYLVPCGILFLIGIAFTYFVYSSNNNTGNPDVTVTETIFKPLIGNFARFLVLFLAPFLTMGAFAQEKRSGTLELLQTYPVSDLKILAAKVVGSLTMVFMVFLPTLLLPIVLHMKSDVYIDWKSMLGCYLGILLLFMSFMSIGLWASSLTDDQKVAGVLSFVICLLLWLAGIFSSMNLPYNVTQFLEKVSVLKHFDSFQNGVLNTTDILFYVSFAGFFLYLTLKSLEARKWRG
ncbi:MAG: ABC transporter permease [Candidatus Xenobia bacterium]